MLETAFDFENHKQLQIIGGILVIKRCRVHSLKRGERETDILPLYVSINVFVCVISGKK